MSLMDSDEDLTTGLRDAFADVWMELPVERVVTRARARRRNRAGLVAAATVLALVGGVISVAYGGSPSTRESSTNGGRYGIVQPPARIVGTLPPLTPKLRSKLISAAAAGCRADQTGKLPPLALSTTDGKLTLRIYARSATSSSSICMFPGQSDPEEAQPTLSPGVPLGLAQALDSITLFGSQGFAVGTGVVYGVLAPGVTSAQFRLNDGSTVTAATGKYGFVGYADEFGRVDQSSIVTHSAAGTYVSSHFGLPMQSNACRRYTVPCTNQKLTTAEQRSYCAEQVKAMLAAEPGLTVAQRSVPVTLRYETTGLYVFGGDNGLIGCGFNSTDAWFPATPFSSQATTFTDTLAGVGIGGFAATGHVPAGTQRVEIISVGKTAPVPVDSDGFYYATWTGPTATLRAYTPLGIYTMADGRVTGP